MASLFGRIIAGAVAGGVGTLAMDLVWYRRYKDGGGEDGFADWEFATGVEDFENASAPAKAGKRMANAVGVDLPDEAAAATTNVMHWLTGVGYGATHGLLQHRRSWVSGGAATAVGAFANSYVTLGMMGLYQPIWEYDADTLWKDLSAHLVFGLATGITYAVLTSDDDND